MARWGWLKSRNTAASPSRRPEDCELDDMSRAAMATGSVDLILTANEIGQRLVELGHFPRRTMRAQQDFGCSRTAQSDQSRLCWQSLG
jgi:hypothetical protein